MGIPLVCLRTERSKARPLGFSLQEGSVISIVTWCPKARASDRPIESFGPQEVQATFLRMNPTRLLSPLLMSPGPVPLRPRLPRSSTRWPPTLNWARSNQLDQPLGCPLAATLPLCGESEAKQPYRTDFYVFLSFYAFIHDLYNTK